jgi:outer membrane protein
MRFLSLGLLTLAAARWLWFPAGGAQCAPPEKGPELRSTDHRVAGGPAPEDSSSGASFQLRSPLSLEDAIRLALEQNRHLRVENFSRSIARANLLAAWGQFDPALVFQRSYQQSFSNAGAAYTSDPVTGRPVQVGALSFAFQEDQHYSLGLQGTLPTGTLYTLGGRADYVRNTLAGQLYPDGYQSFGGISVTQPLLRGFGFGTNLQGVRIARADRKISEWAYRQIVIDTVTQVIVAFSDLQLARDNLRVAQRARELAAGLLNENERRFKIGSMSRSDVTQARAQEGFREEPILIAERALRDRENALRALIGQTTFSADGPGLPIVPPPEPAFAAIDPPEDLRRAYDLRPDYQSARQVIRKAQATESSARNQLLPQVDFVGSYGYNGLSNSFADSRRMVSDRDNRGYSAGVVVSVPLTFAQGRGRYRSAKLTRLQSEADLQRLEQDIALNLAAAAGQIETTRARIRTSRAAYAVAAEALSDEEKKLRAGTSSTFVVLQLQQNRVDLESRVSQALADHRRAVALYAREIGTSLEVNHVTLAAE